MFSKLTGASFPQTVYYIQYGLLQPLFRAESSSAFVSLPQRKASFGRIEPATPPPLTSTSCLGCIINSAVGTCYFLNVLISLLNQTRQVPPPALAALGSS